MVNNINRWIPPILWGILLAVLSLMPGGKGDFFLFGIPHIDKIAHISMYAVWAFLVFNAWKSNSTFSANKLVWLTFLFGTLVGTALEFAQDAMPMGRSYEIWDIVANGIGSFVGALIGLFLLSPRSAKGDNST